MLPDSLIFDFDGTIADTETIEYESVAMVWTEHGIEFGPERWAHVIGQSWSPQWVEELRCELVARGEAAPTAADIHRRQHDHKAGLMPSLVTRPGVRELITAAHNNGVPLAIASNSPLRWVQDRLAQLGLSDDFGYLSTLDVASKPKPDGAPYREACEALDARPEASVAFEDSTTGTASAVHAGLLAIVCPGPLTELHTFPQPHWLIRSHEDVSLASISAALERHVAPG